MIRCGRARSEYRHIVNIELVRGGPHGRAATAAEGALKVGARSIVDGGIGGVKPSSRWVARLCRTIPPRDTSRGIKHPWWASGLLAEAGDAVIPAIGEPCESEEAHAPHTLGNLRVAQWRLQGGPRGPQIGSHELGILLVGRPISTRQAVATEQHLALAACQASNDASMDAGVAQKVQLVARRTPASAVAGHIAPV